MDAIFLLSQETSNMILTSMFFKRYQCFTFNSFKYLLSRPFHTTHKNLGLEIKLLEAGSNRTFQHHGHKVAIHHPFDLAHERSFRMKMNFNQPLLVLVTPHLTMVDQSVAKMSPQE